MFYVPLFSVKSIFYIKFMASLLLISLIIQRQLLMLKIGISLGFIDIINKSWNPLQAFGWNVKPLFKKYQ